MSFTRDDTDFLYDFDRYDQEKLVAEIEVLNKGVERSGRKSSGSTPSLAHPTPMTRATIPRYVDYACTKSGSLWFSQIPVVD